MSGIEKPSTKIIFNNNDYLMGANEIADKYNFSNLTVRKLAAWSAHESGTGIRGNNPCNMRCSSPDDNFYYNPGKVWEIIGGKTVYADPNNPKDPIRKFKYYDTLGLGMEALISWLQRLHPKALSVLSDDSKNGYDFGLALGEPNIKHMNFYTGNKIEYAKACQKRFEDMLKID